MFLSFIRLILFSVMISASLMFTVSATTISIINNDGALEGLNDTTPVSPVAGNTATTLGAQYLNVFQAAADYWEERLESPVIIRATAELNLLVCDSTSAVLGSAGPSNAYINFPNAPLPNTIYTVAQASSLAGVDLDVVDDDIGMEFNNGIGKPGCLSGLSWWLGINSSAPSGTISFYDTILHELAHGLGFLSFVSQSGEKLANFNDTYMVNLYDKSTNKLWTNMTNSERASSSVNAGNLVWNGATVLQNSDFLTSGLNDGRVRMYAPSPYQSGSSVSHWDTALVPDEIMEPFATATSNDCATTSAFKDMGWITKGDLNNFSFTQSVKTGYETEGTITISVERLYYCGRTPQVSASVTVSSSDGSANSEADYTAVNQVLAWNAGEVGTKTINVTIIDDGLEEEGETLTLNLSSPTGGATLGATTNVELTIEDKPSDGVCFPVKTSSGTVAVICL